MRAIVREHGLRFTEGNAVALFHEGGPALRAMMAAIEGARSRIHLETYILRGDATGLSEWAKLSINANPDMAVARRRVKHPEIQEYLRMPVACAFDQESNRLIICDTMRGRLQVYEKDLNYKDPQFNL